MTMAANEIALKADVDLHRRDALGTVQARRVPLSDAVVEFGRRYARLWCNTHDVLASPGRPPALYREIMLLYG